MIMRWGKNVTVISELTVKYWVYLLGVGMYISLSLLPINFFDSA